MSQEIDTSYISRKCLLFINKYSVLVIMLVFPLSTENVLLSLVLCVTKTGL